MTLQQQIIGTMSTIVMGFKNTMDIDLSSIEYMGYQIHFRRGTNFLAIVISNNHPDGSKLVNQLFEKLQDKSLLHSFKEYAKMDMHCDNDSISDEIKKVAVNIDFHSSITSTKKELGSSFRL